MSLFASLARRGLARRGAPSMAVGRAFGARYMSAEKPSLAEAKEMPTTYSAMSNDIILAMSAAGDLLARQERLTRHVMAVDGVDWDDADVVVKNIASDNHSGLFLVTLPYKTGIAAGVGSGLASLPMVFDEKLALWFNEAYVTMEIPPQSDLDTWLEVGSWTWGWMEPPLGTISFVLLALQFSRAQMVNIGLRPYTGFISSRRVRGLQETYSQYDAQIIEDFALSHSPLNPGS